MISIASMNYAITNCIRYEKLVDEAIKCSIAINIWLTLKVVWVIKLKTRLQEYNVGIKCELACI